MAFVSEASPLAPARRRAQELVAAGELAGARELLDKAVELGRANLAEDDPDVLLTACHLGRIYQRLDDHAAARRVLEEAYAAGQWRLGDHDPLMVEISHDIGVVAEELGNRHEARKAFTRVAEYGPAALGANHEAVVRAQAYLGHAPDSVRSKPAPTAASPAREPNLTLFTPVPSVPPFAEPGEPTAVLPPVEAGRRAEGGLVQPPPAVEPVWTPAPRRSPEGVDEPTIVQPVITPRGESAYGGRPASAAAAQPAQWQAPHPRTPSPGPGGGLTEPLPSSAAPRTSQAQGAPTMPPVDGARSGLLAPGSPTAPGDGSSRGEPTVPFPHGRAPSAPLPHGGPSAPFTPDAPPVQGPPPMPPVQGPPPMPPAQGAPTMLPAQGESTMPLPPGAPTMPLTGDAPSAPGTRFNQGAPGTSFNHGAPGTSFNHGAPGTSFNHGAPGTSFDYGAPGTAYNHGVPGTSFNQAAAGTPFNQAAPGTPYNQAAPAAPFNRGAHGTPFDHGAAGTPPAYGPPASSGVRPTGGDTAYRKRGVVLFAAIAAVLASIIAVAALVFVLANRGKDNGSATASNVPTLAGAPPTGVRLRDRGAEIEITWKDPTAGTVSFMIVMAHPGEELKPMATLGPGKTSYQAGGLSTRLNYCFAVVAVYGANQFATSPQSCTSRGSATPGSSTGK